MKEFLKKHGVWILLIAAIVVVSMACLSAFGTGVAGPVKNLAGIVTSPFRAAGATVTNWIDDRVRWSDDYDALKEENAALRRRVAELEEKNRQAQTDSDENARLRKLLNLRPHERNLTLESAMVVDRTSSNWTRTLTLGKGSAADIAVKDCVINEEGYLVGLVSEVGTNWCTVTLCVDTDFEMGATVFRSGDAAVATGNFNRMADGELLLTYIPAGSTVLNGDLIVSSGLGGFYPSGLVIGSVKEVLTDDSGATDSAILSPAVDSESLTEVFVITDYTVVD